MVDKKLSLKGVSQLIIPPHFSVANAVGAALGTVAGTSEVVESLSAITASLGDKGEGKSKEEQQQLARDVAIQRGKDRAVAEAVRKGIDCFIVLPSFFHILILMVFHTPLSIPLLCRSYS